jgi:hypothetical protein
MLQLFSPETICKPFSRYSHGALVEGRMSWLHISGQVGAKPDGSLEQGFEAQARRAWANLIAVLSGRRPGLDPSGHLRLGPSRPVVRGRRGGGEVRLDGDHGQQR